MPSSSVPEFVCAMEDVLEVYHRQFEDNEVLVCLDETSKQQVKETRSPWLGFTHFKRRRRGNLQAGGTGRLGVPAYRS